jgi:hypothetical protein
MRLKNEENDISQRSKLNILIICDPQDKYTLNIKVATYCEALGSHRPDEILIIKPDEDNEEKEKIKNYIRLHVKPKLREDRKILYVQRED